MKHIHRLSIPGLFFLLVFCFVPLSSEAQIPSFQPLLTGHRVVCAEFGAGFVFAGLMEGGLVQWDPQNGRTLRILTRKDGLGGHRVADLAWIEGALWVATTDGGLTVIDHPGTVDESSRIYSGMLSSLKVTAVAGHVVGGIERIYYGTEEHGMGVITGRIPGAYYSIQNGLISDTIVDLAVTEGLLLVATPVGVSRFADNIFTNYSYGDLGIGSINDLEVGPDGVIWAATNSGVRRWNDETRTMESVFGAGFFLDLAADGETIWALAGQRVYRKLGEGDFEEQDLPAVPEDLQVAPYALAAGNGHAWFGGQQRNNDLVASGVAQAWLAPVGDVQGPRTLLPVCQLGASGGFVGAAIDSRSRPWLGDVFGRGLASYDEGDWYNVTHRGTEENDYNGLFNWYGNILVMARAGEDLWFNQFGTGAIRFRPAAEPGGQEVWEQVHPSNSGMLGRHFVVLAVHPEGPVFFCTDGNDGELGVDVLIDPDHWQDPASWIQLGPDLLGGNNVWAVGFERRDVVWFGVRGSGLQRWAINGPDAGPDGPLVWDTSAANWLAQPLNNLSGSTVSLEGTNAIVKGPDGSLWAGGTGGLVNFRWRPFEPAVLLGEWKERTQADEAGLLATGVVGMALDRNDHLWILTTRGLNRLRLGREQMEIDAYTDIATFPDLPSLYSPAVISPLTGGEYNHLVVSADRSLLLSSSNRGGTLISVPEAPADDQGIDAMLAAVYLYPSPFPGDAVDPQLRLGRLMLEDWQRLSVEVFNMEGQMLFQARDLHGNAAIWDGRNFQGRRVASGFYLIKLSVGHRSVVKTLAVAY